MSNKRQTAVDWLVEQILKEKGLVDLDIQQAKQMEKEQIQDAFMEGDSFEGRAFSKDFENYYNQTYNTPNP